MTLSDWRGRGMRRFLTAIWDDDSGVSATEYALLVALISILVFFGSFLIGTATSAAFDEVGDVFD